MLQQNNNDKKAEEKLLPKAQLEDAGVYSLFHREKNGWGTQIGLRLV